MQLITPIPSVSVHSVGLHVEMVDVALIVSSAFHFRYVDSHWYVQPTECGSKFFQESFYIRSVPLHGTGHASLGQPKQRRH